MEILKSTNKKGFTLIELIATIAILGFIMTPISIILYNGYKSYFEEQNRMMALSVANDAIEMIINDLRKFEETATQIDNSEMKLTINDNLTYTYDQSKKTILKNGVDIFAKLPDAKVLSFKVSEKSEEGFDAKLIIVSIDLEYNKSPVVNLYNTYRRRY